MNSFIFSWQNRRITTVVTKVKHRCIGNVIHKPMRSIGKYRTNTYNNQKYEKTGWWKDKKKYLFVGNFPIILSPSFLSSRFNQTSHVFYKRKNREFLVSNFNDFMSVGFFVTKQWRKSYICVCIIKSLEARGVPYTLANEATGWASQDWPFCRNCLKFTFQKYEA